jgi:viologen exporter family transport system permease protein
LEAWVNRRSFWLQVAIMLANDLAWVAFWLLFFARVGSIRGWDAERTLLLFAILTTVAGISLGLLANARKVGHIASSGGLDAVLALPVHPLAYLLVRRIDTAMLGDLLFGPLLFVFAGGPTLERTAVFFFATLCAATVMVGFLVAAGSSTMFTGGGGEQAELGFQAILILASYPLDVFAGATKLLLFTAVPAAFITGLPTRLVDHFEPATAMGLVAAAALFGGLGVGLFELGLRRYTSGSAWTKA